MYPILLSFRDIDKVDELMQDIAEQQELADEISTAISKPVGIGEEFDEVRVQSLTAPENYYYLAYSTWEVPVVSFDTKDFLIYSNCKSASLPFQ